MLIKRVIPVLLLRNGQLYKTTKFNKSKYVGDPLNAIKVFNDKGVDELILLDIDCAIKNKNPDFNLIEKIAQECFMPICYGGGINKLETAKTIFSLGVEKISLNSAILNGDYNLVEKISKIYGSQSLVGSIDLTKNMFGKYKIYSKKNKYTNKNWINILNESINYGIGEILIQNMDLDGTMNGADLNLIKKISELFTVPIIYSGGINSFENIQESFNHGIDAVAAGSYFVLYGKHKAVLLSYLNDVEKAKINKLENK